MQDEALIIRPFQSTDLQRVQRIRAAAFAPIFQSFRDIVGPEIAEVAFDKAEAEQAALLNGICEPQSMHQVFVVEEGSEIIGFVSMTVDTNKRTAEIGLNAVDPAYAGHGVGAWMYQQILARMIEQGAEVATVGTGGDPSHAPARRAYEKAGFGPALPSVFAYRLLRPRSAIAPRGNASGRSE